MMSNLQLLSNEIPSTQHWCSCFQEHNGGRQEEAFDGVSVA